MLRRTCIITCGRLIAHNLQRFALGIALRLKKRAVRLKSEQGESNPIARVPSEIGVVDNSVKVPRLREFSAKSVVDRSLFVSRLRVFSTESVVDCSLFVSRLRELSAKSVVKSNVVGTPTARVPKEVGR